ncbi:MAG: GNAT family N-acetyltransferase [Candidatus Ornithospirochaeta sp.]
MLVRSAEIKDGEEILSIYTPYVQSTAITFEYTPPTISEMEERIEERRGKYPFLVLEDGNEILGYAYLSPFKEREAYSWSAETSIYLKMDIRGKGLGSILLEALEEEARKMNILTLDASIALPREETEYLTDQSKLFHEKRGYNTVAHFPQSGYKFGYWFDMIWMEKVLGDHTSTPKSVIWYGDVKDRI